MQAAIVPVTPFQQNCTLMWCEETMEGAVVDPGGEIDRLLGIVDEQGIKLVKILVTHGHIDHAGGVADLAERLEIPIEGPHKDDKFWIDGLAEQGDRFGTGELARSFTPDRWLDGGDTVSFGNVILQVRHCPGHTPGHVIFFHEELRVAQVGDVLFQGSIGRTDFPKGDHDTLLASIRNELWPLGDDVTFIPGHGPTSTFGQERRTNPFVADG
ncbi:MAG: MBL fold metallo-hydrolase [Rhodospirillaceae bacterium]|jgi:hydroxyacylglutathione hydrolase|nr:MBL fold metallo-hydrolase [Rhodospirillaceae bacterium]